MRWRKKIEPKVGDIRHTLHFAWLPIEVREHVTDDPVTVWLERYIIGQEYTSLPVCNEYGDLIDRSYGWVAKDWRTTEWGGY